MTRNRLWIGRLAILTVCVLLLWGVAGVAAADHGGSQHACPGENKNQGLENADDRGAAYSFGGISTAFDRISCDGDWDPEG